MRRNVLVSFDLNSKETNPESYREAYSLLQAFGMRDWASNRTQSPFALMTIVELPTTTVIGSVEMGPATTPSDARDQLLEFFAEKRIPVTHLLVAFVDDYAGIGEPI